MQSFLWEVSCKSEYAFSICLCSNVFRSPCHSPSPSFLHADEVYNCFVEWVFHSSFSLCTFKNSYSPHICPFEGVTQFLDVFLTFINSSFIFVIVHFHRRCPLALKFYFFHSDTENFHWTFLFALFCSFPIIQFFFNAILYVMYSLNSWLCF